MTQSERYYHYWRATKFKSSRDFVFQQVLGGFLGAPLRILEVGGIRTHYPDHQDRFSDGWASMFWSDYLMRHGGHLDICDVDAANLDVCKDVMSWFAGKISLSFHCRKGEELLAQDNGYNFIYLDGGNDPNETLIQFKLCRPESIVLVDDWGIKGTELEKHHPNHIHYIFSKGHTMGLYYPGSTAVGIAVDDNEECLSVQKWCNLSNFNDPAFSDRLGPCHG